MGYTQWNVLLFSFFNCAFGSSHCTLPLDCYPENLEGSTLISFYPQHHDADPCEYVRWFLCVDHEQADHDDDEVRDSNLRP